MMRHKYDAVVIGGGFYGCNLALSLKRFFDHIVILEKEGDLLLRASYNNQARVHNGYHYPKSVLTAIRSRINFPRFVEEFSDCIYSDFENYYAISGNLSNVTVDQFKRFCQGIGAQLSEAPNSIRQHFDLNLVDNIFLTTEHVFDADKLRKKMIQKLEAENIEIALNVKCINLQAVDRDSVEIQVDELGNNSTITAALVFNCSYSQINTINRASGLEEVPLKHELTEMALVEMPDEYNNIGVTVMCGPFFSLMPFPAKGLHTLSHVRYTPHCHWHDGKPGTAVNAHDFLSNYRKTSNFSHMQNDAQRYLPFINKIRYVDSLWEIKTVLPISETDDSRPILFRQDKIIPRYTMVLGGKIDNIYDMQLELDDYLSRTFTNAYSENGSVND